MKRVYSLLPLLLATACGASAPPPQPPAPPPTAAVVAPPPRTTPDAPFREKAPGPEGKVQFVAPKITEAKLKNGLRVLIVQRHELPIVTARLVVNAGAGDGIDARPALMSFLGSMLEQGTKKRDALKLSDDYEAIGANHSAWIDWDTAGVSIRVLSDNLDEGLELMSDVALSPSFPEAELDRLRTRRLANIQAEKSSPGTIASNNVAAVVFGRAHPYGHNIGGDEDDVKKLTRAGIVAAYDRLFNPKNAALVVAGDVTPETLLPKLEATFGAWKNKPGAVTRKAPAVPTKPATDKRIVFVNKPGAQSQVQLVRTGVPYSVKDREAYGIANAILGGMFSSRVNMNLREKNAYTYGARSYFSMRHGAGPFSVGAAVIADKTGAAVKEVLTELEGLRRDGPTEDELALAKESALLAMPGRFETVYDVAASLSDIVAYDLPLDEFEKKPGRIEAVTAGDVKRVASEFFDPSRMTIVVVGDKATVLPQLEALGLGGVDERDAFGNPLKATDAKASDAKPKK